MDFLRQTTMMGPMGPWIATFLLGFTIIVLFLRYSSRNHDYWKNKGVPYVKPYPVLGSVIENVTKPLHETDLKRYKKFGRIYGYFEGNRALLTVGEPEILRNILVKDFHAFTGGRNFATGDKIAELMLSVLKGKDWKRVRTIITPTFTTGRIKRMIGIFKECSTTLVKNFKEAADKEEPTELKSIYGAFTMDVIASSAFSSKIGSHNDPNNEFVRTAREMFTTNIRWRFALANLFPRLMELLRFSVVSSNGLQFFKDVSLQIIEERKKTGQRRNDFLQLLMDTVKEVSKEGKLESKETENDITENYGKDENDVIFKNILSNKSLSHDELIAQCIVFFLAGYDTSASTLSFVTYLLALNPDIQEKVIEELDDVIRDNDSELTYEAIQSLKYMDNVILETLRIFPPETRIERVADEAYKLGDTGIEIKKGTVITVPVYAMHRDPEYFPEPEKFNPDRFNPEEREKRSPYVYLPFGAGPRNCIGMRFVLVEMKVCLAYVLSNFRIKKCPQTKVPVEFLSGFGLQPKDITVRLEARKDAAKAH